MGPSPPQRDLSTRQWLVGLAVLLFVTIAVRVHNPTGWLGSDDAAYYSAAQHILTGTTITRAHHHNARMAVVVPVTLSVAIFGDRAWAVALPMFVASVLCVVLVAWLGALISSWRAGLLAGLIVAVLPYFRVLSTTAYADTHVCLWATAAMLLCVLALRYQMSIVGGPMELHQPSTVPHQSDRSLTVAALFERANLRRAFLLFVASGFALGLAISSKVFAATALAGMAALIVQSLRRKQTPLGPPLARGEATTRASEEARAPTRCGMALAGNYFKHFIGITVSIGFGGVLFFLVEGAFYSHVANDFLFSLHSHEQSQANVPAIAAEVAGAAQSTASMMWDRITLLNYPSVSGWGWLGTLFWPAVIIALFCKGTVRCMAIWAAATFLLVGFAPVSLANGYQPYPLFHGRHILPACVPFALCLSHLTLIAVSKLQSLKGRFLSHSERSEESRTLVAVEMLRCAQHDNEERVLADGVLGRRFRIAQLAWPAMAALVVGLSYANPRELRGFCDRPTGRVGDAIAGFVQTGVFGRDAEIFMTPSAYWRYNILFPEPLRARLRIAADENAPDWWRNVAPGIADRLAPIPATATAYVIATPDQLEGRPESWDYGVTLPAAAAKACQNQPVLWTAVREPDRRISITTDPKSGSKPVALLLGPAFSAPSGVAEVRPKP